MVCELFANLCPHCRGEGRRGCNGCAGTGYIKTPDGKFLQNLVEKMVTAAEEIARSINELDPPACWACPDKKEKSKPSTKDAKK